MVNIKLNAYELLPPIYCQRGHLMDDRYAYICWKCGGHIITDIQQSIKTLENSIDIINEAKHGLAICK